MSEFIDKIIGVETKQTMKVRRFWIKAGDSPRHFRDNALFGYVTLAPVGSLLLELPDRPFPCNYTLYRVRGKPIVKREDGKTWKSPPKNPIDKYAWELLTDPIKHGLIKGFCPYCGMGLTAEEWDNHIAKHDELLRACRDM